MPPSTCRYEDSFEIRLSESKYPPGSEMRAASAANAESLRPGAASCAAEYAVALSIRGRGAESGRSDSSAAPRSDFVSNMERAIEWAASNVVGMCEWVHAGCATARRYASRTVGPKHVRVTRSTTE